MVKRGLLTVTASYGRNEVEVKASDEKGNPVLIVEWDSEGYGIAGLDELEDRESDVVFNEVLKNWPQQEDADEEAIDE